MHYLTIVETILRDRIQFFSDIRDGKAIPDKIVAMLISSFAFLAMYGLVMGANHSVMQAASSAIKLPLLFLATLAITAPSLHFFYVLFGSQQTILQTLALILAAISTTTVLLLSLAPITFFFLITGSGYAFYKLLNVVFFGIAGLLGVAFLRQGIRVSTESADDPGRKTRGLIFVIWAVVYGFVGSQMAWTLSPFLGDPELPFIVFRHGPGSFFVDVLQSIEILLR